MQKKQSFLSPSQVFLKLALFCIAFLLVTGILGPYIIGTPLLYGFSFFLYANLGKLVLFSCVVLFLLFRQKKLTLPITHFTWIHFVFILCGFLLVPVFFVLSKSLLSYHTFSANIPFSLLLHVIIIAIPVLLALGIFSPLLLWTFVRLYWPLLGIGIICAVFYDISIFYIWKLWPVFSNIVLVIMKTVFSWSIQPVSLISPRTLFVRNFSVTIAESCSGIDSMYLLLTLYVLIVGIDWKLLDIRKVVVFFFPLFIGMFFVNILRVYLLIWLGLLFGPRITIELFHTYLGLVLFFLYFLGFLYFLYPKMKLRKK